MGVPSFYKWLITRYPNIVVNAVEEEASAKGGRGDEEINTSGKNPNGIEFDNLYLDMNGIIHPCFHPDDHLFPPTTFDEVFKSIFIYIDRLFQIVRPRKLLYLAIDGVAPRAKMNQQRSRRFRTAKDAEIAEAEEEKLRKQFEAEGKRVLPKSESEVSDSNIITPGTEFMDKLSKALKYYVRLRLSTDPGWKAIKVILSDANVPGEGEHKIMNFIRLQRKRPGYDPNTRHCLYGLDADLIMLALATHELHFSILREDLITSVQQPSSISSLESSISKADESSVKSRGWLKNVISNNGAVALVKKPYQILNLWTLREYLELDLKISDPPFPIDFERIVDDFICMCFFVGNDFLPHMPTLQIHEGAIDLLMAVYKDEFKRSGGYLVDMQKVEDKKAAYVKLKRIEKFILSVGNYEDRIFKKRYYLQQGKLKKFLRDIANGIDNDQSKEPKEPFVQVPAIGNLSLESKTNNFTGTDERTQTSNTSPSSTNEMEILQNTKELKQKLKDIIRNQSDILKQSSFGDKVRLGMQGWRERYYKEKFSAESSIEIESIRKDIVQEYMKGICWVLRYYFSGVPSWTWFYPFHHGPFASDLKGLGKVDIKFKMGAPFKPFDQLMGVLPPRSVKALPNVYWNLMTAEDSVLKDFYPTEFEVDVDGKRFLWQGIVKLNFINEDSLLLETRKLEKELKDDEIKRNSESQEMIFINRSHALSSQVLSIKHSSDGAVGIRQAKLREVIDVNGSDGINGFLCPCEDMATMPFHIEGMDDVSEDGVMSVLFELPDNHLHIPRLLENVNIPEKTITEGDIVKTPLWHEYEGWTPNVRPQSAQRCKQVVSTDISSKKEIWKEGGSGWSATGRGKMLQGSRMNIQSSAGIGAAHPGPPGTMSPGSQYRGRGYSGPSSSTRNSQSSGSQYKGRGYSEPSFSTRNSQSSGSQYRGRGCSDPSFSTQNFVSSSYRSNQTANGIASPSYVSIGRGRTGLGSSNIRSNSIGNEFPGVWRGGRGRSSGYRGGTRMGNGSLWPSRNVSTEDDDSQGRRTSGEHW